MQKGRQNQAFEDVGSEELERKIIRGIESPAERLFESLKAKHNHR